LFAVTTQAGMFLATALTGVVLAAAFDWLRVWRAVLRPRGAWAHLLDAAFLPVGALVVAGGLLLANWGELRAYALAGIALGAWAWARLGSPLVLPLERAVAAGLLAAGRGLARAVTWPARRAWRLVRRLARRRPPAPPPA
jgi:spore cortex biosynthesis protein YabQ